MVHQQGSDGDRRDGEGVGPPGEKELQFAEASHLGEQKQGQKQTCIVEHAGKGIDVAGEFGIGNESHCRRCDKNEQGRHQLGGQRVMEQHAVEDDGQEDNPEQHADAEGEPGDLHETELGACHGDQYVAHNRNEPGRVDVMDLVAFTVHPGIHHVEREAEMEQGSQTP